MDDVEAIFGEATVAEAGFEWGGPLLADDDHGVANVSRLAGEAAVLLELPLGKLDHAGRDQDSPAGIELGEDVESGGGTLRVGVEGVVDDQHAAGASQRLEAVLDGADAGGGGGDLRQGHSEG